MIRLDIIGYGPIWPQIAYGPIWPEPQGSSRQAAPPSPPSSKETK